jgi:hypothetical protein
MREMLFHLRQKQEFPVGWGTLVQYTRKKAQVVTNLQQTCSNAVPTTCEQGCVRTSCSQLVNGLLTTCYKVVDLNTLVTMQLFW